MTDIEKGKVGSSFDDFLEEEGIAEEVSQMATKKVLAALIKDRMEVCKISKADMARQMDTSRTQVDRLLDPENEGVTLKTIQRAAQILGRNVRLELV